MRDLRDLDMYRVVSAWGDWGDEHGGCFSIPSPIDSGELKVIASSGNGWDHVSVSRARRCPNWIEMEAIKRMFFRMEETAMQIHVPPADHVNRHPYCLHLWRPHGQEIPRPPTWMVGPKVTANE